MAVTPLRMLLFLGGATAVAIGTAYVSGALEPLFGSRPSVPQSETAPPPETAKAPRPVAPAAPEPEAPQPDQQAAIAPAPDTAPKPDQPPAPEEADPLPPSFDILRVEPDGSIVIAGKASPNAEIEILSGSKVLGKVTAGGAGDFAAALDNPLEPGDYQIVLRSTTASRVVANSKETAVVSIPETKEGQVLALVEQPGAPSRLITKPEPAAPVAPAVAAPAAEQSAQAPQPAAPQSEPSAQIATGEPAAPAQPAAKAARPAPAANVAVDAVEIEGRKIFVAGSSDPGKTVRIYANDILLGDARTSPEGRFLIEAERDLPVGDYVIRADVLGPDGAKVIARAAVPFSREPGENIAAVAPQAPAPQAPTVEPQPAPSSSGGNSAPGADPASDPGNQPAGNDGAPSPAVAESDPSSGAATSPEPAAPDPQQPSEPQQQAAAPEADELAPKLEAADGAVIIRRGDSLWRISKRVYGRGVRYSTIYLANQEQIKDPNLIWPGQIFRVPESTEQGEKADMKAIEPPSEPTGAQ